MPKSWAAAPSPYVLQAEIAACHARARTPGETDWPRIVTLYAALAQLAPSPVVELNRAVAVAMAFGPAAGLELVDFVADHTHLQSNSNSFSQSRSLSSGFFYFFSMRNLPTIK